MAILARPHLVSPFVAERPRATPRAQPVATTRDVAVLYAEQGPRIHRFLRDLLGDVALAADATQETFVRAYKKLPELAEDARVTPWLFGIARNVSLEVRRARHRAARVIVACDGEPPDVAGEASPESEVLGREAVRIVGAALSKLPEERRAMLLLRLDHAMSYDDIAVTMGYSLAKVKVEIFRAREVLRSTMAEYRDGGEAR